MSRTAPLALVIVDEIDMFDRAEVSNFHLDLYSFTLFLNDIFETVKATLNTFIQDGKEMASVLYTYRSCVKALPQGVCWNSQFGIQKLAAETGAASIYCGFWF
ncbi:hypothetical protein PVK06_012134 [Gossypium arboreum]|uniref:Uncharacterized protein n=1 Tax=Gossypium arboreum TaxID=29729 RepID=A0ABR0QAK3_GOSAR|nr:hypothetical protein PVK06_012134 [Gossypium arboreum]